MSNKKIQSLHFGSVEEMIDFLPVEERKIVEVLRNIIFESIPNCREKLAYNVPFYYRRKRFAFIWPSSVPWGNVKANGVQLGFTQGHLMNDEMSYLEKNNRKHVFSKTFFRSREIEAGLLKMYLFEAVRVDDLTIE